MSESLYIISKEDDKRLEELLDEITEILKDHPSDEMERLEKIYKELVQINAKIPVAKT